MNLRQTQQELEDTIARSIESAEGLHRLAATNLFEQLGQVAPISGVVQGIRPAYENGVAQLFDLGRNLNRTGGEIARNLIERIGV